MEGALTNPATPGHSPIPLPCSLIDRYALPPLQGRCQSLGTARFITVSAYNLLPLRGPLQPCSRLRADWQTTRFANERATFWMSTFYHRLAGHSVNLHVNKEAPKPSLLPEPPMEWGNLSRNAFQQLFPGIYIYPSFTQSRYCRTCHWKSVRK